LSRITAWIASLTAIVGALIALQAGLAQLLPPPLQKYFNVKITDIVEKYLTSECDLSGDWNCTNSPPCKNPPDRQASIRQVGYQLFFHNERNDPDAGGVWVKPRLVFVPNYDPGQGGAFAVISNDCKTINWSNKEHTIWQKASP
jgi:hypothetical protein